MTNQPLPPDKRAIAGKWLTRILLCVTVELGCLLIADTLHLQFQPEPPAQLSEAELQEAKNLLGVNFTPEELTSIEITDAIRDRLIAEPRLKPILQSIHKDVISMNWGGSGAKEPLWVKYGAKAFPVLDYYSQSSDPTRRFYGIYGIRKLGKPYTTLWLKKQIKRRTPINSMIARDISGEWKAEFGLDEPQMRREIIQLAFKNLTSDIADHSNLDDPYYYYQSNSDRFNRFLLVHLMSPQEFDQAQREQEQAYRQEDEKKWKSIRQLYEITQQKIQAQKKRWQRWTKLKRLNVQQQQQALAEYDALSAEAQVGVIDNGFEAKRGKLSAVEKLLARRVMRDERSPNQFLAAMVLDFYRDAEAYQPMRDILNGDLHKTERSTSNANFTLILERLHKKYPDTRYMRGCEEYSNLTGRSYFGSNFDEVRDVATLRRIEQKTPAQRVADWQDWLNRYPDHPGADDATEHLALSLLAQGEGVAAAHQWIRLMTRSLGDGDARFRGYRRLRVLLDVGLTTAQIQTLLNEPDVAPIAPLLRYALAVHLARDQDYGAALKVSNGTDLTRVPYQFLRNYSYFNDRQDDSYGKEYLVIAKQKMQATLTEQRQRWQQLYRLQQENTAAARYEIASDWADPAGWKNGYLALWIGKYDGDRWRTLPTVSSYEIQSKDIKERFRHSLYFYGCRQSWVCDTARRGEQTVRGAYQKGNPNAVALSLYERLLHNPQTPAAIKEKTLYMEAVTLAAQLLYFEQGEAQTIHPPAGVMASPRKKKLIYDDYYHLEFDILGDYQRRIDRIVAQLQQQFPKSRYTDDLLMSNYFLGRQKRYLEQVVKRYPHSDRADEARYLLGRDD